MDTVGQEVHQNVLIYCLDVVGKEINVDLYGGDDLLCGCITYDVPDRTRRYSVFMTLQRWKENETPLAYVRMADGSGGRLVEQFVWERDNGQ